MISRQNNLELHLIELFYIGIQPEVRWTDGRSVSRSGGRTGHVISKISRMGR